MKLLDNNLVLDVCWRIFLQPKRNYATGVLRPSTAWKVFKIWSLFWSVFSWIRAKYGDLRSKSPYLVRLEENTDQKKLCIWTPFTQCSNGSVKIPVKSVRVIQRNCEEVYTFSNCEHSERGELQPSKKFLFTEEQQHVTTSFMS